MVKKIKFQISSTGEVSLSVEGAVGAECEAFSQPFEQELGIVAKKEYKDSFYQEPQNSESVTQGEGEK